MRAASARPLDLRRLLHPRVPRPRCLLHSTELCAPLLPAPNCVTERQFDLSVPPDRPKAQRHPGHASKGRQPACFVPRELRRCMLRFGHKFVAIWPFRSPRPSFLRACVGCPRFAQVRHAALFPSKERHRQAAAFGRRPKTPGSAGRRHDPTALLRLAAQPASQTASSCRATRRPLLTLYFHRRRRPAHLAPVTAALAC